MQISRPTRVPSQTIKLKFYNTEYTLQIAHNAVPEAISTPTCCTCKLGTRNNRKMERVRPSAACNYETSLWELDEVRFALYIGTGGMKAQQENINRTILGHVCRPRRHFLPAQLKTGTSAQFACSTYEKEKILPREKVKNRRHSHVRTNNE